MADAAKRASDAFLDDDFEAAEELFTQVLSSYFLAGFPCWALICMLKVFRLHLLAWHLCLLSDVACTRKDS